LTAVVILLSKYFSKAKENKNNEKIEISNDGINVNKEKKIIYFLFAIEPLTFILFLIEFFISTKIITKKIINKIMFKIKKLLRFFSFSGKKLLSKKVRKVRKETANVNTKISIINRFLFMKVNIN
tara:strand:- start:240 stop:614 length:375 start_codon:yes stop_codon:yes gene_type:complete